jgi:hypothetical protein
VRTICSIEPFRVNDPERKMLSMQWRARVELVYDASSSTGDHCTCLTSPTQGRYLAIIHNCTFLHRIPPAGSETAANRLSPTGGFWFVVILRVANEASKKAADLGFAGVFQNDPGGDLKKASAWFRLRRHGLQGDGFASPAGFASLARHSAALSGLPQAL